MEQVELNKILDEHRIWLRTNGKEGQRADLCYADLDYSAFPLCCGGLDVNIDDRQATQLLYHLIRNVNYSKNTSKSFKKICRIKSLVKQANNFHRAEECGIIKEDTEDESRKNGTK